MARENPLVTLGVPRAVIIHEKASRNLGGILQVAETLYRDLGRRYHPDNLESGDPDLMRTFTDAIEELRDPDALDLYVDELVGTEDIEEAYWHRQTRQLAARDSAALSRLAEGFTHIDQFRALGITQPTSYLADLYGGRVVIDVLSPSEACAHVADMYEEVTSPPDFLDAKLEVKYLRGVWRESYINTAYEKRWMQFRRFSSNETAMLVGFVALPQHGNQPVPTDLSAQTMIGAMRPEQLDWSIPTDCWFLPGLRFAGDAPDRPALVLYKPGRQGLFAVTGYTLGSAPIKN